MIIVNLGIMMARRKISLGELAEKNLRLNEKLTHMGQRTTRAISLFSKPERLRPSVSLHWKQSVRNLIASRGIYWSLRRDK